MTYVHLNWRRRESNEKLAIPNDQSTNDLGRVVARLSVNGQWIGVLQCLDLSSFDHDLAEVIVSWQRIPLELRHKFSAACRACQPIRDAEAPGNG